MPSKSSEVIESEIIKVLEMGVVNGCDVEIAPPVAGAAPVSATDTHIRFRIKNKIGYSFDIFVNKWPTSNCQLSAIGSLNYLLQNVNSNKEDVQAIIKECYALIKMKSNLLILVDVHTKWIEAVEQCFTVVHKYPYTSTNGSGMCLFMVKL